ncbi:MAG: hypothetical protein SFU98_10955 [Leptospiraceae bacterium]|nr:hypothetical protein [Leptospiraceae bacterium]
MNFNETDSFPEGMESISFSKKTQPTSLDLINIPNPQKITHTLNRILFHAIEKQKSFLLNKGLSGHISGYITLDKLSEILSNDPKLFDAQRNKLSIDDSIKQMMDVFTGGKTKYGYLYPFLSNEENKVKAKIALIAAVSDEPAAIHPLREACFENSIPVIDAILKSKSKSGSIKYSLENTPLIKTGKEGELLFFPQALSLEYELTLLLRKGFQPYSYIPMNDFIADFLEYGMKLDKIISVNENYHFIADDFQVDSNGDYISEPALITHFRHQWTSLEKVMDKLAEMAKEMGFYLALNSIDLYKEKYETASEFELAKEISRAKELADIAENFPLDESYSNYHKQLLKNAKQSSEILFSIIDIIPSLSEKKEKLFIKEAARNLLTKISIHSKESKTLYVLDMQSHIEGYSFSSHGLHKILEQEILKLIRLEMGFHETLSNDGKKIIYLMDPGFATLVIHGLTKLTLKQPVHQKHLDIAKMIYSEISSNKAFDINIDKAERIRLLNEIDEFEKKEQKRKQREEFEKRYNIKIGFIAFLVSILYFMALYSYFESTIFLLLTFPVSLVTGIIFAIIFKKKNKSQNDTKSEESLEDSSAKLVKNVESILFKKEFHNIEERIHDRLSLHDAVKSNLAFLRQNSDLLKNEKNNDKAIATIENAIISHSAVIHIPKEFLPKNRSDIIIISRDDLKSPLMRSQLAEHFYYKSQGAKKFDSNSNLFAYYNFLYGTIERDYFKYTKRR